MTRLRLPLSALLLAGTAIMGALPAAAQAPIHKDLLPVPSNQNADVRLELQVPSPTLREGSTIELCFSTDTDGYVSMWNIGTSGRVSRIYPYNQGDRPAQVKAGSRACAGDGNASHQIKVSGPYGMEDTYLVWTRTAEAQPRKFSFSDAGELSRDLDAVQRLPSRDWATVKATYQIVPATGPANPGLTPARPAPAQGRTWVLAMGANVGSLTKTNLDAQRFATQAQSLFRVPAAQIRLIENATRRDFEGGMAWLRDNAAPGDLVMVHFSGHGTTIADDDGDEADGLDEAFVTYDAEGVASPDARHVVRDDDYARMVNALRTDRVVTVIDACHSGGMQKSYSMTGAREKFFVKGALGTTPPTRTTSVMTQRDLPGGIDGGTLGLRSEVKGVVLAASREDQFSFEGADGGIFTTALLEAVTRAGTLQAAFDAANSETMRVTGSRQTPTVVGNASLLAGVALR
ncbi:hypothetical protein J2847_003333 [Azospirillum agricola]|uniref:caspase family protein n=1 Tax=Azospirillum agricola TaxID=1720247 RepID=UPI001AE4E236|nr:caspase family protein [Azospirillum agricola]MBP2230030.1 hypothetical protein [Azospirillum agricola]